MRDFQLSGNYEKIEKWPFFRPFFYKIHLDLANKKYLMIISTEKGRKYMSHTLDFISFIIDIFSKFNERFSKVMKLEKIENCPLVWQIFHQLHLEMAN